MKAISSVRKSALCGALDGGRSLIKDVSVPQKGSQVTRWRVAKCQIACSTYKIQTAEDCRGWFLTLRVE
jgi:hypothetical protein